MSEKTVWENVQAFGIKQALHYMDSNPDANIPKLLDWFDKLDKSGSMKGQRQAAHAAIDDPGNNWYRLIKSLWSDVDSEVRKTLFENLVVNATFIGGQRQKKNQEKHNCNIPWAILMDPTSACNLHCTGCWAAEYGNAMNMDYETLDSIIRQGRELGTYMYIYSGGEPLVRRRDIIRLCEQHGDCMLMAFTNGTLIDEEFTDQMLRVKNFVPAISIEGYEAETDDRRGAGTYKAVIRAMDILKRKKLLFGASLCYTSRNAETIGSEAYIDHLIDMGCKFAWLFTYMPVGASAPTELLARPEQREYMYRQIRAFRETRPLFTMDFWNDGEYVKGCIAGGRNYLHINANGDIEPCAFIHYSDSNIREKTLLEAYQSPLFMRYREGQPFNQNHLRPCPLLDNYGRLAEMVHASGAHSTDLAAPEDVDSLCGKCKGAAERWTPVADRLWRASRQSEMCQSEVCHSKMCQSVGG
ncbi:MAG: radical SAM protein [Eubacteriales bacterium]|nr:radical SAM protein [Eubacteriales bacterium]